MSNDATLTPQEMAALGQVMAAVQKMEQSAREARESSQALRDEVRAYRKDLEELRQKVNAVSERLIKLEVWEDARRSEMLLEITRFKLEIERTIWDKERNLPS